MARSDRSLTPAPRRRILLASIPLLALALGAGCSADRPLGPAAARPGYAAPPLVLEAGGNEIARIVDPDDVTALLQSLPAAERTELFAAGSCTTRDPAFRAVLADLRARSGGARGGFAGHIRNQTWGEIKVRFLS